ncbi:hypothetical protein L596_021628 [Steinernema carpocapsae]|nr:hypothetical protein L596_021628 [Steinernema carpocapsae]
MMSQAIVILFAFIKEFLRIYRINLGTESNSLLNLLLFGVQTFIGYCLMATFMILNVWLCLAVVLGEILANLVVSKVTKQKYEVF